MRRAVGGSTGLALAGLLILAGAAIDADPVAAEATPVIPILVPKQGEEANLGAPELSSSLFSANTVDPRRIEEVLNRLAAPQPDIAASVGGSHSSKLYRRLSPLVVLIVTDDGLGSGSIVSADGTVLTNNHVIFGYDEVGVILKPAIEGASPSGFDALAADVVKVDQVADLALIRIRTWTPSSFVELGNPDAISVGDDVHAIGHPRGETWTYTKGVISQMRNGYAWSYQSDFDHQADVIQTQTPINPGNSGGPLFDDDGRLIGVNSFGDPQSQGLNFAISVREVSRFLAAAESRYAETFAPPDEEAECELLIMFTGRNDDNTADIRLSDNDCDDYPEMVEAWFDDPALGYVVEFDEDHDGKWETIVVDSNSDGKWDFSLYDTDADGVPDLRGLHPDGGWQPSEYERV